MIAHDTVKNGSPRGDELDANGGVEGGLEIENELKGARIILLVPFFIASFSIACILLVTFSIACIVVVHVLVPFFIARLLVGVPMMAGALAFQALAIGKLRTPGSLPM